MSFVCVREIEAEFLSLSVTPHSFFLCLSHSHPFFSFFLSPVSYCLAFFSWPSHQRKDGRQGLRMLWWGCGILIVRAPRKENTDSPVLHSRIGRGRQWVKGSEKKLSPTQQGGENAYKRNRKSCLRKVSPDWRDVGHRWRSRLMQTGLELLFSSSLIVDKDYIFCEHREDRNIEKDFKCSSERVVSLLPFVSSVTTWT